MSEHGKRFKNLFWNVHKSTSSEYEDCYGTWKTHKKHKSSKNFPYFLKWPISQPLLQFLKNPLGVPLKKKKNQMLANIYEKKIRSKLCLGKGDVNINVLNYIRYC